MAEKPNIIIIFADDLGYGDLECYGSDYQGMVDQMSAKWLEIGLAGACPLPNFKRLMDFGTTFTNTITSNPVCCPTCATIATGLTTRQHGVLENGYELDPELPTFMRVLQNSGYKTGGFGYLCAA